MSATQPRKPAGTPAGGEFSTKQGAAPESALSATPAHDIDDLAAALNTVVWQALDDCGGDEQLVRDLLEQALGTWEPARDESRRDTPADLTEALHRLRSACSASFCIDEGHRFCTPDDAAPISEYRVEVHASHNTSDGVSWTGVLLRNGRVFASVENSGTGGSNKYTPDLATMRSGDEDARRRVLDELADWHSAAAAACPRLDFDQADVAVGFLELAPSLL